MFSKIQIYLQKGLQFVIKNKYAVQYSIIFGVFSASPLPLAMCELFVAVTATIFNNDLKCYSVVFGKTIYITGLFCQQIPWIRLKSRKLMCVFNHTLITENIRSPYGVV